MTQDLETRLRATLVAKAESVQARDLSPRDLDDPTLPRTDAWVPVPARRRSALMAAAAVLVVAVGLAGLVLDRDRRAGETPVAVGPRTVADATTGARAWPLTGDEPLPEPSPERPATPDLVARAYLTDVIGLPAAWPVRDLTSQEGTALVDYVLQDVPAELVLARADNGAWFVTGAATDLVRPSVAGEAPAGVDVAVGPGPRTYSTGVAVRLRALGADGRELASAETRAMPAGDRAAAAPVVALRWSGPELAAVVQADVFDDHDADPSTPDMKIGHWTAGLAAPAPEGLPAAYDVRTADAVFTGTGSPDDVAVAYLRSRFPDYPAPGIETEPARTRARRAFVDWSTEQDIAEGTLFLRQTDDGWSVVASTTTGVDASDLRIEGGRLFGRVSTTNGNALYADVLRPDGSPVAGAPRPEGHPDAAYRFATAAGPANGAVDVDVPIDGETPVVRVGLVGGTILSVTEYRAT